jgi:hypothetical protein
MDDFLKRQLSLMQQAIEDYRDNSLSLNTFIQRVEAIGNVIGGELWAEKLFPAVVDLESVNSEIIDKGRQMTSDERDKINAILNRLQAWCHTTQ